MKKQLLFLVGLTLLILSSCKKPAEIISIDTENWSQRRIDISSIDSLMYGKSYLSVYSQIYSFSHKQKFNLTGMISLRNTSDVDTVYLLKAVYFDTDGKLIRTYFDKPVFLAPMETTEIIINQTDIEGGTGSNFLFDWKTPMGCPEPIFEGVMSSMQGTQGLAFTTQAKRIK